jgi:receptor protein-tyrosine kinase
MRRPPARRISPWSTLSLCEQLRRQWFTPERAMLAVVSTAPGEASARLAAQLATAFADLGHRTLLIDGDMRSPALHRELGLDNSGGLAGLLERGRVDLARVNDNLSVIVAGRPKGDPLELLTHRRLRAFLADARQHFSIVLMHAPSAAAARDYEMFAALAGGALVMGDAQRLQPSLERCGAQVAAAVGY